MTPNDEAWPLGFICAHDARLAKEKLAGQLQVVLSAQCRTKSHVALYTATDYDALRNYLALANKTNKGLLEERDALRAEVEKYKTALQEIANFDGDPGTPIRNSVKKSGIARRALNAKGDEGNE